MTPFSVELSVDNLKDIKSHQALFNKGFKSFSIFFLSFFSNKMYVYLQILKKIYKIQLFYDLLSITIIIQQFGRLY